MFLFFFFFFATAPAGYVFLPSLLNYYYFSVPRAESFFFSIASFFFDIKLNIVFFFFFVFVFFLFFFRFLSSLLGLFFFHATTVSVLCTLEFSPDLVQALWNGAVIPHPALTFCAYSFFLCFFILRYFSFFFFKDFFFFRQLFTFCFFIAALSSVMLGALWAQQELNWGGWWGWDPVELGALCMLIYAIFIVHFFFSKKISPAQLVSFFFFFIGVRAGFFSSVHNFISEESITFYAWLIIAAVALGIPSFWAHGIRGLASQFFFSVFVFLAFRFFSFFITSFSLYVSHFQHFFFWVPQAPSFCCIFFFVRKSRLYHFFIFLALWLLVLFKLAFFFSFKDAEYFDFFCTMGDFFFYTELYTFFEFFFYNVHTFITATAAILFYTNLFFLDELGSTVIEVLQQTLFFYNWLTFSEILIFFFLSPLLSFSVFLLKKKKKQELLKLKLVLFKHTLCDSLRFQKSDQKVQVSQKKRSVVKRIAPHFKFFGSISFFFLHQVQLEFIYLRLLKRRMRIMLKRRGNRFKNRKIWFNLRGNFPVSKKSKNSRMGKGKGLFLRWVVRIRPFSVFFSFFGFSFYILVKFKNKINFLLKSKLFIVSRYKTTPLWSSLGFVKVSSSQRKID